jgi:hypothetical protein
MTEKNNALSSNLKEVLHMLSVSNIDIFTKRKKNAK